MDESEMFKKSEEDSSLPRPRGVQGKYNNEMTDQHRLQLKQIRDRDAAIDAEIVKLGEGIDELGAIARAQNEEVKLQNVMLTTLEEKVDTVHDKVFNVNQRLKNTLEEVRSSDKVIIINMCNLPLISLFIDMLRCAVHSDPHRYDYCSGQGINMTTLPSTCLRILRSLSNQCCCWIFFDCASHLCLKFCVANHPYVLL